MIDLEPIARAICRSRTPSCCPDACETGCKASSSALESSGRDVQARAAYLATLKAIREPDDSSVEKMAQRIYHKPDDFNRHSVRGDFTAMIDHLLQDAGDE